MLKKNYFFFPKHTSPHTLTENFEQLETRGNIFILTCKHSPAHDAKSFALSDTCLECHSVVIRQILFADLSVEVVTTWVERKGKGEKRRKKKKKKKKKKE